MQEIVENVKKEEDRKKKVAKDNADKATTAKKAKKKAEAYSLKMKKFYNPYDGTFHMPDGHREFLDESRVEGVNNYHQTHHKSHDQLKQEAKQQALQNINARLEKQHTLSQGKPVTPEEEKEAEFEELRKQSAKF